jgi:hypothetical protein
VLHVGGKVNIVVTDDCPSGFADCPVECPSPSLAVIVMKETDTIVMSFKLPDKFSTAVGTPVFRHDYFKPVCYAG